MRCRRSGSRCERGDGVGKALRIEMIAFAHDQRGAGVLGGARDGTLVVGDDDDQRRDPETGELPEAGAAGW